MQQLTSISLFATSSSPLSPLVSALHHKWSTAQVLFFFSLNRESATRIHTLWPLVAPWNCSSASGTLFCLPRSHKHANKWVMRGAFLPLHHYWDQRVAVEQKDAHSHANKDREEGRTKVAGLISNSPSNCKVEEQWPLCNLMLYCSCYQSFNNRHRSIKLWLDSEVSTVC